ncbi:MAG TPA: YlxR family protein [Candidatus Corynebacterium avicola]|uniref:YlxR family protein n=1 Tax=Candidatus Corynebacterium avicola TaxID=2838527 RepID=A0A9D1RPL3_9CORY|nr:YlxR family protein [Candidatus Corynebacterium avicola]
MSTRPSTPSAAAGPQRTCIATRNVLPDTQLLRCVVQRDSRNGAGETGAGEGTTRVVPDPRRRLPGRGAWITATRKAYETAVQRRAFARALNVPAETDTTEVLEYIRYTENTEDTAGSSKRTPTLTTSPVAEKEKETDY